MIARAWGSHGSPLQATVATHSARKAAPWATSLCSRKSYYAVWKATSAARHRRVRNAGALAVTNHGRAHARRRSLRRGPRDAAARRHGAV